MPTTKSAKKALRVSKRRREINLKVKKKVDLARREINKVLNDKEKKPTAKKLQELLATYYKAVDKAGKRFFHRNKTNRLKSSMIKKITNFLGMDKTEKKTKKVVDKTTAK